MNTWVRSGVHVPAFSNPTTASLDGLTAATPMASLHVGAMPEASVLDLFLGRTGGAFIETVVAEAYAKNYPELCVKFDVPYEQEGSVAGVSKDNGALLAAVNLAIAAAKEDGSMDKFVAEANTLAEGNTYEGLLDNQG